MKRIILVVSLMFGGAALVNAQDQRADTKTQSSTETSIQQDQDKQEISVSELPEPVRSELESQDYAAWTVGTVYKKMDESQNEIYIVEMRQGTETKKVKFDRDGNKLEGKDHGDKSGSAQYRDESADETASDEAAADETATESDTQLETETEQK